MKGFKRTLASVVTALTLGLSSACGHGNSQVHFSQSYDAERQNWLTGVKIQNSDGTHAVGLKIDYGEEEGSFKRKDVDVPFLGDIPVYTNYDFYRIIINPYLDRELYKWEPCDHFSAGISLGVGYSLELRITSSDFNVDGEIDFEIDDLPTAVRFPGRFLLRMKPELKIWQIPLHYTLQLSNKGDLFHHLSVGYEF